MLWLMLSAQAAPPLAVPGAPVRAGYSTSGATASPVLPTPRWRFPRAARAQRSPTTPTSGRTTPPATAVAKVGSCPSGHSTSGDYCLASGDTSGHAVAKTGSCPSGYSTSGDYCLSN